MYSVCLFVCANRKRRRGLWSLCTQLFHLDAKLGQHDCLAKGETHKPNKPSGRKLAVLKHLIAKVSSLKACFAISKKVESKWRTTPPH